MNKYEQLYEDYKDGFYNNINPKHLKELVERATPMKPSNLPEDDIVWWQCPKCNGDTTDDNQIQYNYCPICGQALDWNE